MLIRSLWGRSLTNTILYSFQLEKKTVVTYFNNNFRDAREQIAKVGNELHLTKQEGRKFFHYYPRVFRPNSKEFQQVKQRIQYVNKIAAESGKRGEIGKVLSKLIFQSNHLPFRMTEKQIQNMVETIQKYFSSQSQIQKILKSCPNLLNPKLQSIVQEKLDLFTNYLQLDNEQSMKVFQASPFLLAGSTDKLKTSIIVMYRVFKLTKQQVVQQMKDMGEVFMLGGRVLEDIHKTPIKWGLTEEETKEIFLKHPLLFFNYPYDVMKFKRKILKYLNFTAPMGLKLFKQYPQILIWSVRSLEEKALFLTNRLQVVMDEKNIQLLSFNFNKTIRPRGELLLKTKTVYNNHTIVDIMKLSDQQFVDKLGISLVKLQQQIAKFPISIEMDFRRSKKIERIGLREKLLRLASVYQNH